MTIFEQEYMFTFMIAEVQQLYIFFKGYVETMVSTSCYSVHDKNMQDMITHFCDDMEDLTSRRIAADKNLTQEAIEFLVDVHQKAIDYFVNMTLRILADEVIDNDSTVINIFKYMKAVETTVNNKVLRYNDQLHAVKMTSLN